MQTVVTVTLCAGPWDAAHFHPSGNATTSNVSWATTAVQTNKLCSTATAAALHNEMPTAATAVVRIRPWNVVHFRSSGNAAPSNESSVVTAVQTDEPCSAATAAAVYDETPIIAIASVRTRPWNAVHFRSIDNMVQSNGPLAATAVQTNEPWRHYDTHTVATVALHDGPCALLLQQ